MSGALSLWQVGALLRLACAAALSVRGSHSAELCANGLTRGGLLLDRTLQFLRQLTRATFSAGVCGGFQPVTAPSLSVRSALTPPGEDIQLTTNYTTLKVILRFMSNFLDFHPAFMLSFTSKPDQL
jgi:hypothetical protein